MHRKLSTNALSNLARYGVQMGIVFLLTPFIIGKLGSANYGLWVLVLSLVGYSGLLEMGVQTSVVKLVAQYSGRGDLQRMNQIVSCALAFFVGVGVLAALATWFVVPVFLERLVADPANREMVRNLLLVLGLDLIVVFPNYVFTGVVFGMQAYHNKNLVDVACSLVNALITFLLLERGFGLIAVIAAKVVTDVLIVLNTLLLSLRVCPQLRPGPGKLSKDAFVELFVMGGKVFSSATAVRLANNAEPLIISSCLGNTWTAIYSIPKRLLDYVKEISWTLTTGFMPTFSDLQARNDLENIRRVYFQYTRYIQVFLLPLLAAIFVYGNPFIRLWVGEDFALKGRNLVYLMTMSAFLESLQPLAWRLLIGVGKIDMLVRVSVICSLLYASGGLLLVYLLGIDGLALSALAGAFISLVFSFALTSRFLAVSSFRQFLDCQMRPILSAVLYLAALYAERLAFPPASYAAMTAQVLAALPVYLGAAYFGVLKKDERSSIRFRIRRAFSAQPV